MGPTQLPSPLTIVAGTLAGLALFPQLNLWTAAALATMRCMHGDGRCRIQAVTATITMMTTGGTR